MGRENIIVLVQEYFGPWPKVFLDIHRMYTVKAQTVTLNKYIFLLRLSYQ